MGLVCLKIAHVGAGSIFGVALVIQRVCGCVSGTILLYIVGIVYAELCRIKYMAVRVMSASFGCSSTCAFHT